MRCFYCADPLAAKEPLEHILPAAVGGSLVTDKVCGACNQRAGREVDQPWQEWPPIMELRNRFAVPNRDGKKPRPVTWRGTLPDGRRPAAVNIKGDKIDVRILPFEHCEGDRRVLSGAPADIQKQLARLRRASPRARVEELPSEILDSPLSAHVSWELSVHVWPRFVAKVVLGAASLVAGDDWIDSAEAGRLRDVLWNGHQSTVDAEMLPPGRAWSLAPFDVTDVKGPVRAPEHLIVFENWGGTAGVSVLVFGTFLYSVPVVMEPGPDVGAAWLFDPLSRRHTTFTRKSLQAENMRRQPWT